MQTGFGYDLHPLKKGRRLILGGVEIPFEKGLDGHSDADVLCHAIGDALLGAAVMGDIGEHFPDNDSKYKNANSLELLQMIGELLKKKGFAIIHIDSTVLAEAPKLLPHRTEIIQNLSNALGVNADLISVKAKTNEGMDSIGRGEAIAVHAVATITSSSNRVLGGFPKT